jgi:hypothetical protein
MNPGCVAECELYHSYYLAWRFAVGAVESLVIFVGSPSLILPAVMCPGCRWFECWEITKLS